MVMVGPYQLDQKDILTIEESLDSGGFRLACSADRVDPDLSVSQSTGNPRKHLELDGR